MSKSLYRNFKLYQYVFLIFPYFFYSIFIFLSWNDFFQLKYLVFFKESSNKKDSNALNISNIEADSTPNHFVSFMKKFSFLKKLPHGFMSADEETRVGILKGLTEYAIKEPLYPINETCTQDLDFEPNCAAHPDVFSKKRDKPAKVAHLIQFGCDVDVLEIHLNELYAVVDKFFITESVIFHKLSTPKLLTWPIVSKQERFKKFLDKVVYFPITKEVHLAHLNYGNGLFQNENVQERLRWEFFLKWNKEHDNYFGDNDVIGFGDTDEIASYKNVLLLKHCQQRGTTDIGIWFTFGKINMYGVLTGFHIRGVNTAYGDPTYYLLKDAKKSSFPSRQRGRSPYFLIGGLHLTLYQYLPSVLTKTMSETEGDAYEMKYFFDILEQNYSIFQLELLFSKFMQDKWASHGLYHKLDPKKIGTPPFILPWFLACNQKRYSSTTADQIQDKRLKTPINVLDLTKQSVLKANEEALREFKPQSLK